MNNKIYEILTYLFLFSLIIILSIYYVSAEKIIYYWDFAGYWEKSISLSKIMNENFTSSIKEVLASIRNDEYTMLPILPISALMYLIGNDTRTFYILSVTIIYFIPSILALRWMLNICFSNINPLAIFISVFSTSALFLPIYRGLPDVGGILIIFAIYAIFFKSESIKNIPIRDAVIIGILIFVLAIFRRWYLYWIIWFFLLAFGFSIAKYVSRNRANKTSFDLNNIFNEIKSLLIAGSIVLLLLMSLAPKYVHRLLFIDYSDIYSAYRPLAVGNYEIKTLSNIGGYYWFIVAVGFMFVWTKGGLSRRVALFLVLQLVCIFYHFNLTANFGIHHLYLLIAVSIPLLTVAFDAGLKRYPMITGVGGTLVGLIIYSTSFISQTESAIFLNAYRGYLLPRMAGYPLERKDTKEMERIAAYLEPHIRKSVNSTQTLSVYVLSSSYFINSHHFKMLNASLGTKYLLGKYVSNTHDVDKRDGFPTEILTADWLITTDPVQTHMHSSEDQLVVTQPNHNFINNEGIALAFNKEPVEFKLENGAKVFIYRRYRSNNSSEIIQLSDRLRQKYPDRPFIYQWNKSDNP